MTVLNEGRSRRSGTSAAQGCLVGIALALVIWAAIIYAVLCWWGHA